MSKLPAIQYPRPPAHVARFVEALGFELGITFLLTFGGATLYIPDRPTDKSRLVKVIGVDGVARLADVRHLLPKEVPLATPWLARCFKARGMSIADIARSLRRTEGTIRRYLTADRNDYGGKV